MKITRLFWRRERLCENNGVPFYPSTTHRWWGGEGGMLKHAFRFAQTICFANAYESLPQHSSLRSLASFRQACGLVVAKPFGLGLCYVVLCVVCKCLNGV